MVKVLRAVHMLSLGLGIFFGANVYAQCSSVVSHDGPKSEFDETKKAIADIAAALNFTFESVFPENTNAISQESKNSQQISDEFTIVPGKRVGKMHLQAGEQQITSLIALGALGKIRQNRYKALLPIPYAPIRLHYANQGKQLGFAFSTRGKKLMEVFVKNSKYKTANGIGVGSSYDDVKQKIPGKENKLDGVTYWQGRGVSFVFAGNRVSEIVVYYMRSK